MTNTLANYTPHERTSSPEIVGKGNECKVKGMGTIDVGSDALSADYVPESEQSSEGVSILTQPMPGCRNI